MSETHTPKQLRQILDEHTTACEWCGDPGPWEVSHIKSKGAGGPDTIDNVFRGCKKQCARNSDGELGTGQTYAKFTERRDLLIFRNLLAAEMGEFKSEYQAMQEALRRHLAATRPEGLT